MIITIIVLILSLAFVMLFLGYWIKVPFVVFMGWVMLFLLFINLMGSMVEYKTGETSILDDDNRTTITNYNYSEYDNNEIFLYLAIVSGMGFISVFFTKNLW